MNANAVVTRLPTVSHLSCFCSNFECLTSALKDLQLQATTYSVDESATAASLGVAASAWDSFLGARKRTGHSVCRAAEPVKSLGDSRDCLDLVRRKS